MNEEIMQAELIDILSTEYGDITVPGSGDISVQSIGPGSYRCTLPDGRVVIVDQFGNVIGY